MKRRPIIDVQFEHYTPDPSRGAARTSKRFKATEKLRISTDETSIFIEAERETIAIPYGRAIWIRYDGSAEGQKNTGRSKRTRKTPIKSGLPETTVQTTAELTG